MDVAVRITHLWKMQLWFQELQSQEKGNKAGFTHVKKSPKTNTRNIALYDVFSNPETINQTLMSVLLNFHKLHHHNPKASFPFATSKACIPWKKSPCNCRISLHFPDSPQEENTRQQQHPTASNYFSPYDSCEETGFFKARKANPWPSIFASFSSCTDLS